MMNKVIAVVITLIGFGAVITAVTTHHTAISAQMTPATCRQDSIDLLLLCTPGATRERAVEGFDSSMRQGYWSCADPGWFRDLELNSCPSEKAHELRLRLDTYWLSLK